MAKRYIGDAVITIEYVGETPDGRGNYKGTVRAGKHTWRFDELHSGVGGGGDSPEAYDEMAQSAVSFASYYTTHNRGDDAPEWAPPPEVADAIDVAVGYAQRDNGEYEVRRSPKGKVHEEGAVMHEVQLSEIRPERDDDDSKRWIIGSLTDIRTYVSNANPGGVYGDEEATRALVEAIQSAKHPPYGTNWGLWLDANVDALLAKAVPPATAPTRSAHRPLSRRRPR